tara:strand:+ start:256 stop:978 length:723 start_codon:yes stop_codon:yes gene_type:complete
MIVIPAIDLKNGKCVRLREGKMDEETIFSEDPISTAGSWFSQGAEILHIVDLDGAVEGKPMNQEIIFSIVAEFPEKRIQIGGGIRSFESASEYLNEGIERVIMGTSAVEEPDMLKDFCTKFPNRLVLGIDALDGVVKTQGWLKGSGISPSELVKKFEDDPIAAIIFTDISKDGMMKGPNIEATSDLANQTKIPVIASGGVSTLDHITQLADHQNISGVICGRALYEKAFTYTEVLEVLGK